MASPKRPSNVPPEAIYSVENGIGVWDWWPFKDDKEWALDPKTNKWAWIVTEDSKRYADPNVDKTGKEFSFNNKTNKWEWVPAVPGEDEQQKRAGMKRSATLAATLPQVNPKTGATSDLFTGKYGVFEILITDPVYGPELREIKAALEAGNKTLADDLWNRSKWGQLDSDAQSRILMSLQNNKLYKERLRSWLINIKKQIAAKGLKADDAQLEQYYKDGIDDSTILDDLAGGVKATGATGEVADTLSNLRTIARNNGFSLEKDFAGQLDGWMQDISRGLKTEADVARLIRSQAKLGLPQKVASLLDEGLDLANVYAPYRNIMAGVLELNPDSISLSDSMLTQAYGGDKEMSLFDFKRALRKDPRWQYTDNAREEVANTTLGILRDFGFQG